LRLQHSKLIFALVWFLPLAAFPELLMIAQPYGPQFMMLGLALVLLNRVRINDLPSRYIIDQVTNNQIFRNQTIHNYILVALAVLCLFIGFWISELSVIFLFLLLIQFINLLISQLKLFLKTSSQQSQSQRLKQIYRSPLFGMSLTATLMSLFGISFILYAKHYARNRSDEYATFGNLTEIQEIASHLATSVVNTLMFQSENIFLSLHAVLVLVLLISLSLVVPQQIKRGVRPLQTNWLFVFAAGALLSLILLIPSHWVYINNISLRYFTVVYVAGWMAALLLVEALRGQAQRWLLMLLGIMALTASLSLFRDGALSSSPVSEISRLQEVKTLGKVGIIGNYWSSYNLCAVDPASLNCTARDSLSNQKIPCETPSSQPQEIDGVRCPRCARRVLQAETIYLVKRKWLSTFPSEIQQFGRCLTQVGPPRRVASHFMAPYRVKQP
jgi:DNA-directed RNA polymerase subunit RPC12/RpoP